MVHDVFISHSAQDKAVADAVCAAFEEDAIRCWVAPRDVRPGRSFPGEITRAIQHSKVMVLIFSRHSNNSEQVLREVQLAVDSHLPIVRLRIEDIPLSDDLRYYLSTPHWLDALTPPLSKHIANLKAAIKELLAGSTEEAPKDMIAPEPAPTEPASKRSPAPLERKSPANRRPLMIAAAVIIAAGVAIALWVLRPERTKESKSVSLVAQQTPEPIPSVTPQPTPTPEVLAVAVTQPPSTPEKPPELETKSTPATNEVSKKGPLPRNNRTWQAWMDAFVHDFIGSNESNDVDLAVSFYAPKVDLFEEGWKTTDAIRRDIEGYNARWPSRRATIRGDVKLSEKAANRSYTASFEHDYYVENATRGEWINGAVAVDLQITIVEGTPKISSMKQKTLRKEKGTMQPR
jgi:hypothetical protein